MKNGSGRLIVGFFPSQLLPGVRDRVGRSRRHVTAIEDRFAALCLPGETAVAALAAPGSVERVVENMRGYAGPGAVFVIGEEILRESGAASASREPALAAESAAAREKRVREDALLAILAALACFPLSELAVQIVNALVITLLPPRKLPKLDLRGGIGPENATLVVVPMLLMEAEAVRRELEKLEVRFLPNRDTNLYYGLFSDFTDAPTPATPGDDALFRAAREGIGALNARYGERFVLFHREREWSRSEPRWIGRWRGIT